MGVPGVAQEGSRVVSQGALASFSGLRVTTIASMRSRIESTVARIVVKRNTFERILFLRGRQIVLTNKQEKLSLRAAGQNVKHRKTKQTKSFGRRGGGRGRRRKKKEEEEGRRRKKKEEEEEEGEEEEEKKK